MKVGQIWEIDSILYRVEEISKNEPGVTGPVGSSHMVDLFSVGTTDFESRTMRIYCNDPDLAEEIRDPDKEPWTLIEDVP